MELAYAGVGARKTPTKVLAWMERIAMALAAEGHVLHSGGARGADSAFEHGCTAFGGRKRIWQGTSQAAPWAVRIAKGHHPKWHRLGSHVQGLMARNVHILMGDEPTGGQVHVVIGWTEGGRGEGGTGHTYRVAQSLGIPIIELARGGIYADEAPESVVHLVRATATG